MIQVILPAHLRTLAHVDGEVKLEVEGGKLRIAGTRPEVDSSSHFLRMERIYGEFIREFEIPSGIDPDRISAALDSGILTITAPKATIA